MNIKAYLFFIIANLLFYGYTYSQTEDKSGIYVFSVDFNVTTTFSIPCEKFIPRFAGMMKNRLIQNTDTLKMLDLFLNKVKYKRKNVSLDVRAQINYIRPDYSRISICTDGYNVTVNGRMIKNNPKFVDFLRGLCI